MSPEKKSRLVSDNIRLDRLSGNSTTDAPTPNGRTKTDIPQIKLLFHEIQRGLDRSLNTEAANTAKLLKDIVRLIEQEAMKADPANSAELERWLQSK